MQLCKHFNFTPLQSIYSQLFIFIHFELYDLIVGDDKTQNIFTNDFVTVKVLLHRQQR